MFIQESLRNSLAKKKKKFSWRDNLVKEEKEVEGARASKQREIKEFCLNHDCFYPLSTVFLANKISFSKFLNLP